MNFLNSAFDSSNFIKSTTTPNQSNSTQNNLTNKLNMNPKASDTNNNSAFDNTVTKSNFLLSTNSALTRNYCSKTQLYCESISRAIDIPTCNVVPFFGSFLHDFRQILDGVPSQITMCNKNIQKPVEV